MLELRYECSVSRAQDSQLEVLIFLEERFERTPNPFECSGGPGAADPSDDDLSGSLHFLKGAPHFVEALRLGRGGDIDDIRTVLPAVVRDELIVREEPVGCRENLLQILPAGCPMQRFP